MKNQSKLIKTIYSTYIKLVKTYFADYFSYCYQTGSFAYGGGTIGKSDIDITIVFKNKVCGISKKKLLARIHKFINGYLFLHRQTGYLPDLVFPGEYITEDMVSDAINGRGFEIVRNKIFLSKASTEYYLKDPEREFRAWLSQSAFNKFLIGNKQLHDRNKINGWCTILKFLLIKAKNQNINIQYVLKMLRVFGVHSDYYNFDNFESCWILKALNKLYGKGFVNKNGNYWCSKINNLLVWERKIVESVKNRSIRKAEFLISKNEQSQLANYARTKWEK